MAMMWVGNGKRSTPEANNLTPPKRAIAQRGPTVPHKQSLYDTAATELIMLS